MNGRTYLITSAYSLLLRLYPHHFRTEFGDEMQSVFADAVNDAAKRGLAAALDDRPGPWLRTLTGALSFLLFGPITVLLAYPYPYPVWRTSGGSVALVSIIYPLVMLIGLAAGWRARWPRWSFPYLSVSIVLLDHWIAQSGRLLAQSVVPRVFGLGQEWPLFGQLVYSLAFFAVVPAMVFVLMRTVRWLRPLYLRIRQDWTQLAFH